MAHGRLTSAGFSDQSDSLARRNVKVYVVEDLCAVAVGEGDVFKADVAPHVGQYFGIRRVLDLGLSAHQLHKPVKTGHSLRIDLHELHQLADRRGKSGDIERKGDEVDVAELLTHDQKTAHRDDGDLHQADRSLNTRIEKPHRAVERDSAGFKGLVRNSEFPVFSSFVGECLGGSDAGDPALDGGVDLAGPFLDLAVGGLHVPALPHAEYDADWKHDDEHHRQDRVDRQKDDQRAEECERAGQDVLRTVVRQFDDLEQVVSDAGEQDAGPVLVKEAVGKLLHMGEDVPAHIRFHERSHPVSDHGDKILADRPHNIGRKHDRHHRKECPEEPVRQKAAHGPAGHIGKDQVHNGDAYREGHVDDEGLFMWFDIGSEDRQLGLIVILVHYVDLSVYFLSF